MKHSIKLPVFFLTVFFSSLFSFQTVFSQNYTLNNSSSVLEVHGTSSLHDWTLETEKQSGKVVVTNSEELEISSLNFSVEAESLKSGKSAMDKNTFKALNTDDHKTMDFNLTSLKKVTKQSDQSFKVSALGKMTISGVTKSITIDMTVKLEGNKLFLNGEKSFKMTDFGIDPPKALLGTIKTGDAIKIEFKSVFEKK
ncbi:YceI family protein [Winogradskyella pacifica]|jgi:polyisoprenoid-binding protein YceI|uniref:Polyisoprenoid-binding protein YceI n=1 Tax=Winogradskyella pacifica TaxID=664642 RepID=A0A3D9MX26_9FLAO|nr:YceI family protein [Winogradskyella pacifica]REE24551.1 polyisoprenoid-binding protein YceI [Winogradskyella pacifica]